MLITVLNRQSAIDIAIQECGSFEASFGLAARNNLAITDDLTPGSQLEYRQEDVEKKQIVKILAAIHTKSATAISDQELEASPFGGINYMGIEIDFIIG